MKARPIPRWPWLLLLAGLLLCVSPVTAQESPLSTQPQLTPDVRARLSQAAQNHTLTPWQREFMMGMARNAHAGVMGDGRVEPGRAPSPALTTTADGSWFQERGALGGQHGYTAIYDPVRDRMVVFGSSDSTAFNDVWALSLAGSPVWAHFTPAGAPPSARYGHTAIYDPVRDRMVVFGGDDGTDLLTDVWALSLASGPAWTQLTPAGAPPSARVGHTAIYDPVRDHMVVFGGYDGTDLLTDVWALSLAGGPAWTQLAPAGWAPSARVGHTAIYDPVRDRMVVFGGATGDFVNDDVWALSLAGSPAWTLLTAGAPPSARYGHTAIYDPVRDRMVVFGGSDGTDFLNDVWALSLAGLTAWTELTPTGTPPVNAYTAIYDPVRDRMVVFRGSDQYYVSDVWALSLAGDPAWTELTPAETPPSRRSNHTAIYDPVRDRMVVFGGYDGTSPLNNDVWALSLAGSPAWTQLTPAGTPPSAGNGYTAIYDPVRDRMVVSGGNDGLPSRFEVWALSLGSPAWTQLTPAGTSPNWRLEHTAIYDPVRDRMVVFGGYSGNYFNDVWALALAGSPAWTQLTPAGAPPSARYHHTAIYDPVRDRMVVFGGYAETWPHFLNEVWALALAGSPAWTQLTPAGAPPSPRVDHTAIYDPVRDRMVVFGGSSGEFLNDVWALSLAGSPAWTQLTPTGTPPRPRGQHTAIYDPVRDWMVVFGGSDGGLTNDVWELRWAPPTVSVAPQAVGGTLPLTPAYPNPARSDISIGFTLPRASAATLRLYDVSGRLMRTLMEGTLPAGSHLVRWDRRLSSGALAQHGVYFYELRVDGQKLASRRVVLIK